MEFQLNDRCHGFVVTRIREDAGLRGKLVEMTHEKTGASLCWVSNTLENKLFCITFKTIPEDSTGVFHILEHSVLCGSKKYLVREPFVELLKSSMNTFLNAMTASDMTLYPVSSRNDRDLMNLTEVYLDAVFEPRILWDENVFRQEGHHIEQAEDGTWGYKGVVFNEMKGAMSDSDQLVERTMLSLLYPDTSYGFNSGGDPDHIPELTYEGFISAYRRHYHPSNARIYLDGDVPMEEMLPLLDSYLSRYENMENVPELKLQTPVISERTIRYEISEDEPLENRTKLEMARIISSWDDPVRNMALSVVCDVLTGSNEAPLKRAILSENLAQDFSLSMSDYSMQTAISFSADNMTDGCEEKIRARIREMGEKIRREGLDRNALEASINRISFHLRETEEPQGLARCFNVLQSWLYGGDPMMYLNLDETVAEVRRMIDDGRFNALAQEVLLTEDQYCVLRALPSRTIGDEKRKAEAERVNKVVSAWTEEEKKQHEEAIAGLLRWQQTPDTAEALAALPVLTIKDADVKPAWTETTETRQKGIRVLTELKPCNGITHVNLYFNLTDYTLEEIRNVAVVAMMYQDLPTDDHDILSLQQEVKKVTGRLDISVRTRSSSKDIGHVTPYLGVSFSVLDEYLDKAIDLVCEILLGSRFADSKDKVHEIIDQTEMDDRKRVVSSGHMIAMREAMSHYTAEGAVREVLEGVEAIRYIREFAAHFDENWPAFLKTAERLQKETICLSRLTAGVTSCDAKDLSLFAEKLPTGTPVPDKAAYQVEKSMKQGVVIPAQIAYAIRAYNLSECGIPFHGSMLTAANILSYSYLWNTIRVQGGAYGAGIRVERSGNIFCYSFRDPTPARSLQQYAGAAEFLEAFVRGDEDLDRYIISTLNELNPLISMRDEGFLAEMRYLNAMTEADLEKMRQEILHTSPEQILACAKWLNRFSEEGAVCVVGHKDAVQECGDLNIEEI